MALLARCDDVCLGQGAAIESNPCGLRPSHLAEDLGLHGFRLDMFAVPALALGPNATVLSKELPEGAGGPSTPHHGSAHGSVSFRQGVGTARW